MGEGGFAGVQRHELFDGFGVGFLGLDSAGTDEGGAEIGSDRAAMDTLLPRPGLWMNEPPPR